MDSTEYLKIAYTLLPPPLSALPAKYWTSISLLLHSYTVARTFQALLKLAGAKDLPENEAFIIGFLHDLAQKLGKSPETLKVTYRWVLERLSSELKFTLPEARKIAKTLETNPAETVRKTEFPDPLLPTEIWKLLMLADELQNSSDALPWAIKVRDTVSSKFGKTPNILIYSVNLPQPFVRYTLWDVIEEKIEEKIGCNTYNLEECNVFAIASLQRLIVLSELNIGKIEIGWDEIIGREKNRNETDVLSVYDIENLKNNIEKCKSEKTKKDEEQEEKGISSRFKFKNKHCEPGIHRNKKRQKKIRFPEDLYDRVGTYELMLHYFGPEKNAELDDFYLPLYAKDQLYRVSITGVKFEEGGFICPICGVRHREGFVAGIIGDIIEGKSEKWNRFLSINIDRNLNTILRENNRIRVCPLCMLDMLFETKDIGRSLKNKFSTYYTLSLKAPVPVSVLREISGLMHIIIRKFFEDARTPSDTNIKNIKDMMLNPESLLNEIRPRGAKAILDYGSVMVSTNGGIYFNKKIGDLTLQDKLMFVSASGLLAYYGLYPISISIGYMPRLTEGTDHLVSFETTYSLYSYAPRDQRYEEYTPYVTGVLASLPILYEKKKYHEENVKHVEEILGFDPSHSPLFLLYSDLEAYSRASSLLSKFI